MNNVEIILQLLTDLKSEQQLLKEQIKSIQNLLKSNDEKKSEESNESKDFSVLPKSFKEWKKSTQKK
ncbi:preprotein translocase [Bacillus sp. BB56-3]|nr:preprotein translocase [Bacillus sp. BB56-3]